MKMKFNLPKFSNFKKCPVICDSVGVLVFYSILFLDVGLLDYTFAQGKDITLLIRSKKQKKLASPYFIFEGYFNESKK